MSPGLRLVTAPGLLLAAALAVYTLPEAARRRALAVTFAAVATATGLIVSVLPLVGGGGLVERSVGTLVAGVPLAVRGDSTGVVVALAACAACAVSLLGPPRRALECSALLLCLAGTCTVCLAANAVLVYCGLELGNVGFLLLGVAGTGDPRQRRRTKLAFGAFHIAALGLLASALQLRAGVGTADFDAIPDGAVTAVIALPWALAGAVRLAGAAALAGAGSGRTSSSWLPVAALPSGLVVLLRLEDAAATAGTPRILAGALIAFGLLMAVGGALLALVRSRSAPVVGRALLVAAAGQLLVAVGTGTAAAITAAAAIGIALLPVALGIPALAPGGRAAIAPRWIRSLVLAGAGGIPAAGLTAGLLCAAGAEIAAGSPRALVGVAAGAAAVLAALAAGLAVRATLDEPRPPRHRRLWLDTTAAALASLALAVLPGLLMGQFADRVASSNGAITSVGSLAIRGPGGDWAGGYLLIALGVAGVGAVAAAHLGGVRLRTAPAGDRRATPVRPRRPYLGRLPEPLVRAGALLDGADRWLAGQPDVPLLVLGAVAAFAWFGLRR